VSEQKKEKIIDRARKLMAMAGDKSSPEEAAIAARRARSIIDQYQLSLSDLQEESEFGCAVASKARRITPGWEQSLTIWVAELNDCVAKFDRYGRIVFGGFDEDVKVCKFMFYYLTEKCKRACKEYMKSNPCGCRNSFKLGYAWAVTDKIKLMIEARKTDLKTSSGTSLVLIKKDLVEKEFGVTKYGKERQTKSADLLSQIAGQMVGEKTNIVTGLEEDNRHQIASVG